MAKAGVNIWKRHTVLLVAAALACQGCQGADQGDNSSATSDGSEESSDDGVTSQIDVGDKTVELTTEKSAADIPLGVPAIPDSEVAYEMNSGTDGKLKYSGSFNTQMGMEEAMKFYADALTEMGGTIVRDDRKQGRSFQSIKGTLPDNKEFYVHVTDLKKKRGYTQVDLKLSDK